MTFRSADTGPLDPSHLGRPVPRRWPTRIVQRMALLFALIFAPASVGTVQLAAQATTDDMRVRVGVTAGGVGSIGASVEFLWGSRSIDVNLSTFTFSEVSLVVTGKQYFGGGNLRPFVGLGLWGIVGSTGQEGDQSGKALILRVPVGGDWNFHGRHHLGGSLAVNEGLWIARADPEDERPISRRPVPLPGFYYRYEP